MQCRYKFPPGNQRRQSGSRDKVEGRWTDDVVRARLFRCLSVASGVGIFMVSGVVGGVSKGDAKL